MSQIREGAGEEPTFEVILKNKDDAQKVQIDLEPIFDEIPVADPKDRDYIEQLKAESKRMWLTDQFVRRPLSVLILGYSVLVVLTVIARRLEYFEIQDTAPRDLQIWDDKMTVDLDMFNIANQYMNDKLSESEQGIRSQLSNQMFIMYENLPGNEKGLIQKDVLLKIQKLENKILGHPEYGRNCFAVSQFNQSCNDLAYQSPLRVFDKLNITKELKDMSQAEIDNAFRRAWRNKDVKRMIEGTIDQSINIDNMTATYFRTTFLLGGPLEFDGYRFKNTSENATAQEKQRKAYVLKMNEVVEKAAGDGPKAFGAKIRFASYVLTVEVFQELIDADLRFSSVSVTFVFFYFIIHMKSKFLSVVGTSIILFSFPVTLCITEGVAQVTYVGILHVASVYMVLGIAADDIFVFVDAWKRSATLHPEVFQGQKEKRMAYAFRSSARAMAITSSTTSVAFFANIFSPLLPIRSFGVFSGVIIPVNFILVIMVMPSAVIVYEQYVSKIGKKDSTIEDQKSKSQEASEQQQLSPIERFFDVKLNNFVYKYRVLIAVLSLVWFYFASQQARLIGPQTEPEEYIDPENEAIVFYTIMNREFAAHANNTYDVNLYWGVKGIDRTGESQWDPVFVGEPEWDTSFSPVAIEAQEFFIELCDDLERQDFIKYDSTGCWMKEFKTYIEDELERNFPVTSEKGFFTYLYEWIGDEYKNNQGAYYFYNKYFGIRNGQFIFSKITGKTELTWAQPGSVKLIEYQKWQNFTETWNRRAPPSMKGLRQTTEMWPSIVTERAFYKNAIQGVFIALLFAFIILLYATANIIQSLLSIFCVAIVIVSMMAILHLNGQQLGTAESVSLVILIGFSVDFVVHLSVDYMHSAQIRRQDKMRQAYREMGVSILSGCITTFGSGFSLFFGNFTYFKKFALVITSTIIISFITAMLTFGAFCHIFGPEKEFGMIFPKKEEKDEKLEDLQENADLVSVVRDIQKRSYDKMDRMWMQISQVEEISDAEMNQVTAEFQEFKKQLRIDQQEVRGILDKIKLIVNKDCMSRAQLEKNLDEVVQA